MPALNTKQNMLCATAAVAFPLMVQAVKTTGNNFECDAAMECTTTHGCVAPTTAPTFKCSTAEHNYCSGTKAPAVKTTLADWPGGMTSGALAEVLQGLMHLEGGDHASCTEYQTSLDKLAGDNIQYKCMGDVKNTLGKFKGLSGKIVRTARVQATDPSNAQMEPFEILVTVAPQDSGEIMAAIVDAVHQDTAIYNNLIQNGVAPLSCVDAASYTEANNWDSSQWDLILGYSFGATFAKDMFNNINNNQTPWSPPESGEGSATEEDDDCSKDGTCPFSKRKYFPTLSHYTRTLLMNPILTSMIRAEEPTYALVKLVADQGESFVMKLVPQMLQAVFGFLNVAAVSSGLGIASLAAPLENFIIKEAEKMAAKAADTTKDQDEIASQYCIDFGKMLVEAQARINVYATQAEKCQSGDGTPLIPKNISDIVEATSALNGNDGMRKNIHDFDDTGIDISKINTFGKPFDAANRECADTIWEDQVMKPLRADWTAIQDKINADFADKKITEDMKNVLINFLESMWKYLTDSKAQNKLIRDLYNARMIQGINGAKPTHTLDIIIRMENDVPSACAGTGIAINLDRASMVPDDSDAGNIDIFSDSNKISTIASYLNSADGKKYTLEAMSNSAGEGTFWGMPLSCCEAIAADSAVVLNTWIDQETDKYCFDYAAGGDQEDPNDFECWERYSWDDKTETCKDIPAPEYSSGPWSSGKAWVQKKTYHARCLGNYNLCKAAQVGNKVNWFGESVTKRYLSTCQKVSTRLQKDLEKAADDMCSLDPSKKGGFKSWKQGLIADFGDLFKNKQFVAAAESIVDKLKIGFLARAKKWLESVAESVADSFRDKL